MNIALFRETNPTVDNVLVSVERYLKNKRKYKAVEKYCKVDFENARTTWNKNDLKALVADSISKKDKALVVFFEEENDFLCSDALKVIEETLLSFEEEGESLFVFLFDVTKNGTTQDFLEEIDDYLAPSESQSVMMCCDCLSMPHDEDMLYMQSGKYMSFCTTDVESYLQRKKEEPFSSHLVYLIDQKFKKHSEAYNRAHVSKSIFSKIYGDFEGAYHPKKETVLGFAFALELTLDEAKKLLSKAGYTLTDSSDFDLIMRYMFERKIFDVTEINLVLYNRNLPLLGSK